MQPNTAVRDAANGQKKKQLSASFVLAVNYKLQHPSWKGENYRKLFNEAGF